MNISSGSDKRFIKIMLSFDHILKRLVATCQWQIVCLSGSNKKQSSKIIKRRYCYLTVKVNNFEESIQS